MFSAVRICTLAAMLFAFLLPSLAVADGSAVVVESPQTIPAFQLTDHRGEPFTREQFREGWSLVFIGFTSCPDVCPVTLMKLEAVRAELGLLLPPERIPQLVFLAVDPARDEPVLGQYLAHFHPQNIGITGKHDQLQILTEAMGGFYRLQQPKPGADYYDVTHTASIAVVNPAAQIVAKIRPPLSVRPIAEQLTYLIRRGSDHGKVAAK